MANSSSFALLRNMLLLLVAVLPLTMAGCRKAAEDPPAAAVTVQAEHPTIGTIAEEIAADAVLAPLAQAALSARISAPIRAELVQRGTHVHRGQLLLTLEDRDLQGAALDSQGALSAAEANYATTIGATLPEDLQKAELDQAQAAINLDVARRTANERKKLFEQGALSGRDADAAYAAAQQAQAAFDEAKKHADSVRKVTGAATTKAASGQLNSAKGRYISAKAQVSYASLRSPIDGIVTDRPLYPGETAAAGTTIITVMDTSSLLAKLHLGQSAAQKLSLNDEAELQIPGAGEPAAAHVSFISPALDPGSSTVEVWLKLPNPGGRFQAGAAVHAIIHGNSAQNALQIPAAAIIPAEDGGTNVMVAGADGVAHKRAVTVGIRTRDKVQVLSGLSAADMVITGGAYGMDDGTRVTIGAAAPAGDKD